MEVTQVAPYLPSLTWVGICLWHVANGNEMKTREYTRTLIESNSPEGMVLTVPVVGGSSAAKRLKPSQLEISAHGDWTRIHLGAMEAAYGREPYFQHFFPAIAEIIAHYPKMLAEMNNRLLANILASINYDDNIYDLKSMKMSKTDRYSDIRSRLSGKVNPRHSVIEPIFRLGHDTLFLLI